MQKWITYIKMKTLLIRPQPDDPNQTLGYWLFFEKEQKIFECKTLELPWLLNTIDISCITPDKYVIIKVYNHPKYGNCFEILNVKNRTDILSHFGNYKKDTRGCILPGEGFTDIDNDGLLDVTYSRDTIRKIWNITPDKFTIEIITI